MSNQTNYALISVEHIGDRLLDAAEASLRIAEIWLHDAQFGAMELNASHALDCLRNATRDIRAAAL